MCVSVVCFAYFVQQFEDCKPTWDWFRVLFTAGLSALGLACDYRATIISNRIFFIFCLFGNFVFVNTVLSFILIIISSSIYENQIESVNEIIDGSYDLFGDDFALQHFMKKKNEVDYNILI